MKRFAITTFLLVAGVTLAEAGQRCWGSSGAAVVVQAQATYEWQKIKDSTQYALYYGGVQVGAWESERDYYRPLSGDVWGDVTDPPTAKPIIKAKAEPIGNPPTGVVPEMLSKEQTEIVWLGENKTDAAQAPQTRVGSAWSIQGSEVPDLSKQSFITVTSKDAAKQHAVYQEIAASPLKEKFIVQERRPDHWHMNAFKLETDARFQKSGLGVFVQSPPAKPGDFGKIRLAQYEWDGVKDFQRKADPDYKPDANPDGKPADEPAAGDTVPLWALGACVVAFMLFVPSSRR